MTEGPTTPGQKLYLTAVVLLVLLGAVGTVTGMVVTVHLDRARPYVPTPEAREPNVPLVNPQTERVERVVRSDAARVVQYLGYRAPTPEEYQRFLAEERREAERRPPNAGVGFGLIGWGLAWWLPLVVLVAGKRWLTWVRAPAPPS